MQRDQQLASLDRLIGDFGGSSEPDKRSVGTCALFLGHLQAARRYLLGAALDEFRGSARQAIDSAISIADAVKQVQVRRTLEALLA